jgi:hypothetical protein
LWKKHNRPAAVRQHRKKHFFEEVPSARVVRIIAGPMEMLIAGYANSAFGMWNLRNDNRAISV